MDGMDAMYSWSPGVDESSADSLTCLPASEALVTNPGSCLPSSGRESLSDSFLVRCARGASSPSDHLPTVSRLLISLARGGMSRLLRSRSMPAMPAETIEAVRARLRMQKRAQSDEYVNATPATHELVHSTVEDEATSTAVQVYIRVRAHPEATPVRALGVHESGGQVRVELDGRTFCFDRGGGEATTQAELFECVGKPLCEATLAGFNGTIFCYGQTGAGKTYTLSGPVRAFRAHPTPLLINPSSQVSSWCDVSRLPPQPTATGSAELSDPQLRGLTPRILEELFASLSRCQTEAIDARDGDGAADQSPDPTHHYRCSCSYLQIHNDVITDLLVERAGSGGAGSAGLRLRESPEKGTYVEGLREVRLRSAAEALNVLKVGAARRNSAATLMNATSSRSHAVFILKVEHVSTPAHRDGTHGWEDVHRTEQVRTSQLSLVDLAGSERQQSSAEVIDYASNERAATELYETLHRSRSHAMLSEVSEASETSESSAQVASSESMGGRSIASTRLADDVSCDAFDARSESDPPTPTSPQPRVLTPPNSPPTTAPTPPQPLLRRRAASLADFSTLRATQGLASAAPARLGRTSDIGNAKDSRARLQEACCINRSLSALSGVIIALNEERMHVPYRDSKLTHLLKDSIGGSARTWMVANVSPLDSWRQETLSTLLFASRAQRVCNRVRLQAMRIVDIGGSPVILGGDRPIVPDVIPASVPTTPSVETASCQTEDDQELVALRSSVLALRSALKEEETASENARQGIRDAEARLVEAVAARKAAAADLKRMRQSCQEAEAKLAEATKTHETALAIQEEEAAAVLVTTREAAATAAATARKEAEALRQTARDAAKKHTAAYASQQTEHTSELDRREAAAGAERDAAREEMEALRQAARDAAAAHSKALAAQRAASKDELEKQRAAAKNELEKQRAASKDELEKQRAAARDEIEKRVAAEVAAAMKAARTQHDCEVKQLTKALADAESDLSSTQGCTSAQQDALRERESDLAMAMTQAASASGEALAAQKGLKEMQGMAADLHRREANAHAETRRAEEEAAVAQQAAKEAYEDARLAHSERAMMRIMKRAKSSQTSRPVAAVPGRMSAAQTTASKLAQARALRGVAS